MNNRISYNIPQMLAYLYVFFNVFLLPNGLFYTVLLAPFFLYYTIRLRYYKVYLVYLLWALVFLSLQHHLITSYTDYLRSNLLTFLNLSFVVACAAWFNRVGDTTLHKLFKNVVYFNFVMVLVALVAFFIPALKPVFWYMITVTKDSGVIPRLKMLWSEASVYSLVITPFFLYFFYYGILIRRKLSFSFLLLLIAPLLLSNSLGVCLCLAASIGITVLVFRKTFLSPQLFNQILLLALLCCISLGVWYLIDSNNLLFLRVRNIFTGHDTSARGRTYEAFILAGKVCDQYQCWWTGIGPGQFKLLGKEILFHYYRYGGNVSDIRIPNACADTLIVYGLPGLVMRLLVQIVLFFRTGVYRNVFRCSLFVFLFLYQFSGSYYNNLIEWVMWALVFSNALTLFNRANIKMEADGVRQ